jgi:hypothetical protein
MRQGVPVLSQTDRWPRWSVAIVAA